MTTGAFPTMDTYNRRPIPRPALPDPSVVVSVHSLLASRPPPRPRTPPLPQAQVTSLLTSGLIRPVMHHIVAKFSDELAACSADVHVHVASPGRCRDYLRMPSMAAVVPLNKNQGFSVHDGFVYLSLEDDASLGLPLPIDAAHVLNYSPGFELGLVLLLSSLPPPSPRYRLLFSTLP